MDEINSNRGNRGNSFADLDSSGDEAGSLKKNTSNLNRNGGAGSRDKEKLKGKVGRRAMTMGKPQWASGGGSYSPTRSPNSKKEVVATSRYVSYVTSISLLCLFVYRGLLNFLLRPAACKPLHLLTMLYPKSHVLTVFIFVFYMV